MTENRWKDPVLAQDGPGTHPGTSSADGHRPDIDGLRAIAVLMVVGFHAFPQSFPGGFIGVDIFFVISGFLITRLIQHEIRNGNFSFVDFYSRRARRIFPALALVVLATLAVGYFLLTPGQLKALGLEAAAAAAFVPNILFWSQAGYFDASAATKPLLHLWSLGVEEQFYLVWPALLFLLPSRKTGLAVACVTLASLLYSAHATMHQAATAFYLLPSRSWELGAGALLAIAADQRHRRWLSNIAVAIGLIVLATCVVVIKSRHPFPGLLAIPVIAGAMLIVEFGSSSTIAGSSLGNRPFEYLGQVSYPLYLWHWPILVFAHIVYGNSPLVSLQAVCLSIILAVVTHEFVELPIREHPAASLRQKAAASTLALTCVGALGGACIYLDGLKERLPPDVRTALDYEHYEFHTDGRYPDCWLSADKAFSQMAADCIQPGDNAIAIWGDSYAARLSPGLRHIFGAERISQYTRNGCPPLVDAEKLQCATGNRETVAALGKQKPKLLIIFASWESYSDDWSVGSLHGSALAKSIQLARDAGVRKILLLGPAPRFSPTLPAALFQNWRVSRRAALPHRLQLGQDSAQNLTTQLSNLADGLGIAYLAPMKVFCDDHSGCLTVVPGTKTDLVTWDHAHLTTPGATYLADAIKQAESP